MIRLRVLRYDRSDVLLAECESPVVPARGETLQLDTLDGDGGPAGPSTLWRVMSVTIHVPSLQSQAPRDGSALCVRQVEVNVMPDNGLADLVHRQDAARMTESAI